MLRTTRWRALLVCVCTAVPAAAVSTPAMADWAADSPVGSPRVTTALQLAEAHWGAAPCSGATGVSWGTQERQTNATSQWTSMGDPYTAWRENFACTITLNVVADWDWPKFCTVVIHEVGHLEGQRHSADPDDIMAPYYERPAPECVTTADPQAPAAPTASRTSVAPVAKAKVALRAAPRKRARKATRSTSRRAQVRRARVRVR